MIEALLPASLSQAAPLAGLAFLAIAGAWVAQIRRGEARARASQSRPVSVAIAPPRQPVPCALDPGILRRAPWEEFTQIVEALLACSGANLRRAPRSEISDVDLQIFAAEGSETPHALASCRRGGGRPVDSGPLRGLHAAMAARGIRSGYFATNGFFTPEAISFARHHGIELLDIHRLVQAASRLPIEQQQALRQVALSQTRRT